MPAMRSRRAMKMWPLKENLRGKTRLQMTAVTMLAAAPEYSFTMLSSFFRIAATTWRRRQRR